MHSVLTMAEIKSIKGEAVYILFTTLTADLNILLTPKMYQTCIKSTYCLLGSYRSVSGKQYPGLSLFIGDLFTLPGHQLCPAYLSLQLQIAVSSLLFIALIARKRTGLLRTTFFTQFIWLILLILLTLCLYFVAS